jgi:hypothetical protein
MLKPFAGLLLGLIVALPLSAAEPAAAAQASEPAATAPQAPAASAEPAKADTGAVLEQFRDELLALETELVSKNISLTTDEATAFWPVFKQFQAEQKTVINGQIAAVRKYADHYAELSDAQATAYVDALLERDQQIHDLRVEYLAKYSKVIAPSKAARVIQITRRLGIMSQAKLSSVIPLVH